MNILLLYKGHYGKSLRGPELRYVQLAKELCSLGHHVVMSGRSADTATLPSEVSFVAIKHPVALTKALLSAQLLVLHGGGPFILLVTLLASLLGKRVILDAYVPHWIELESLSTAQAGGTRFKTLVKSYFNVLRGVFAALTFDGVIAANQRQLDLYRGMMAPFTLTRDFSRITVIPFGCEPLTQYAPKQSRQLLIKSSAGKINETDFVIGWLGGTYGWFDFDTVLAKASEAIVNNPLIKLVFFGVSDERQAELLSFVMPQARANIVFVPWVDFNQRFEYWSGFDVSLVWGVQGVENDYASRTRNFDCLTLGLPIVQNWDEEWGPRLQKSGAGHVTDAEQLSTVLSDLSVMPDKLAAMRSAMQQLAPKFYWSRFAKQLMAMTEQPTLTLPRRLCGLLAFVCLLPAALMMFLYYALRTLRNA